MSGVADATLVRMGPAVDRWIVAVLVFSAVAMVAAVVGVALDPDVGLGVALATAGGVLGTSGLVWLLAYPIVYEVDLEEVRVRSGVMRFRIPLRDLARVALHQSVLSSTTAAWTSRRLLLTTHAGATYELGPADRLGFLAEVVARAPQLVEDPGARGRVWVDAEARRRGRVVRRR